MAYKIASTLTLAGVKTGLFVSPHVSSFRERCQVDFECITEDEVTTILPKIFDACRSRDIPATFFEVRGSDGWSEATAKALYHLST